MGILTLQEAADILKLEVVSDYPQLPILLPSVDEYIKDSTGKDWGVDDPIDPTAKMAAVVLLVNWFDNPGAIGSIDGFRKTMIDLTGKLQAKALVLAASEVII